MENNIQDIENQYLRAARLTKAIRCLTRNKDKADMYESIAKIYQSLGEYKDCSDLCSQCIKKAAAYRNLVDESSKMDLTPDITTTSTYEKRKKHLSRKLFPIISLLIIVIAIGGIFYLTSKPGRYARASFYEKIGNYEKSYKMFGNLKSYSNSLDRSNNCRYEYAKKCVLKKDYESAKAAYKALGNYRDSEEKLTLVELDLIRNADIGDNILFGNYRWLIVEKDEDKVLLVKSLPVNGFSYNEKAEDVTWENCSLRAYLNNDFLQETFVTSMTKCIMDTNITVPDNLKYGTVGGNATVDKIFLLNAEQFYKYSDILSNYLRDCWLINPGAIQSAAQFVSYGEVMDYGYTVTNTTIHIRPALWVSLK